jgi:Flp pilus assembly CpaF family ATPase
MSPERMVLGEIRSHEVTPFIMAMNNGHKGFMSSIHANSASDALHRLALLFCLYSETKSLDFEMVLKLICKNIDIVVYMENKKVVEVIEVLGSEKDNCFYQTVVPEYN